MIRHIREFNPGIEIIALSMTPIVEESQKKNLKQENINLFNERLEVLCKEENVHFLDVASSLKNSDGYLDEALSSDKYVHLGVDGMNIMIDILYDFARQQLSTNNHAQEVIP
jgi:lysophospholipase L1-like esterase